MTHEWDHLPNALHINAILLSLKTYTTAWNLSRNRHCHPTSDTTFAARNVALHLSLTADRNASVNYARNATWKFALDRYSGTNPDWDSGWKAALDAIIALIAYDDCAHYLAFTQDQLHIWASLSEQPAAVLLLPAVIAFENINQMETT